MGRVQHLGILLLIVLVFGASVGLRPAAAQASKEARGTVTAVSDSSLKVKVGAQDMTFAIDGRSITAGVAPGTPTSTRVARPVASSAPAAEWP